MSQYSSIQVTKDVHYLMNRIKILLTGKKISLNEVKQTSSGKPGQQISGLTLSDMLRELANNSEFKDDPVVEFVIKEQRIPTDSELTNILKTK